MLFAFVSELVSTPRINDSLLLQVHNRMEDTIQTLVIGASVLVALYICLNPMKVFSSINAAVTRIAYGAEQKCSVSKFYDLADKLMNGTPVTMNKFKGDVLCIVNVASK